MGRLPTTPWYPRFIQHRRYARNHHVPEVGFIGRAYQAINHAQGYRRKTFLRWSNFADTVSTQTYTKLRFRCATGEGATHIRFLLGAIGAANAAGGDPRLLIDVTPAGGATSTTTLHFGNIVPSVTPSAIEWRDVAVEVDELTHYEIAIRVDDYCRLYSAAAYEYADRANVLDTFGAAALPVTDELRSNLLSTASDMWRHNGSQLITYPGRANTIPESFSTTTFTNLLDGSSTSVTVNTPGYYLGDPGNSLTLSPWCRLSDADALDCVFAVYAQTTVSASGEVRLRDASSTLCSITGIGTTLQWYTSNVTITGMASRGKTDIQGRVSTLVGSPVLAVHSVCLYAWLA